MSYPNLPQQAKATIVSHGHAASQDPSRANQLDFYAVYQVDPMHRFTVFIPKKDPTEAEVEDAIRQDYQKQKRFINRDVSI